jgi:hypothetical protein
MEENKPKIVFILTARFPTEKAYGVTTEFSARAIKELGYLTSIITPMFIRHKKGQCTIFAMIKVI